MMKNELNHPQIVRGSFSAVSTATIATKYSFCSIFRDLQDFHTFAPLRSQNFSGKPSKFFAGNFSFFSRFSMDFANFLRNFDEMLPEFHRNVQEMTKKVDTPNSLRKTESLNYLKVWKKQKYWKEFESGWPPSWQPSMVTYGLSMFRFGSAEEAWRRLLRRRFRSLVCCLFAVVRETSIFTNL